MKAVKNRRDMEQFYNLTVKAVISVTNVLNVIKVNKKKKFKLKLCYTRKLFELSL